MEDMLFRVGSGVCTRQAGGGSTATGIFLVAENPDVLVRTGGNESRILLLYRFIG